MTVRVSCPLTTVSKCTQTYHFEHTQIILGRGPALSITHHTLDAHGASAPPYWIPKYATAGWVWKNCDFRPKISLYLESHKAILWNANRIRTRSIEIEYCYFQRPWNWMSADTYYFKARHYSTFCIISQKQ